MEIIFLIGRILFGGFFISSGWNHFKNKRGMAGYAKSKKVPMADFAVLGTGALLVVCGLCVIFGVFTTIAPIALTMFLVATAFMMHDFWNDKDAQAKAGNHINFMKNLALAGASLMMLMIEVWPFSL